MEILIIKIFKKKLHHESRMITYQKNNWYINRISSIVIFVVTNVLCFQMMQLRFVKIVEGKRLFYWMLINQVIKNQQRKIITAIIVRLTTLMNGLHNSKLRKLLKFQILYRIRLFLKLIKNGFSMSLISLLRNYVWFLKNWSSINNRSIFLILLIVWMVSHLLVLVPKLKTCLEICLEIFKHHLWSIVQLGERTF